MDANRLKIAGQILRSLRIEYGLTQREVAAHVSILGPTLCTRHFRRFEKGEAKPMIDMAMSIATVLDSDVYEIWG